MLRKKTMNELNENLKKQNELLGQIVDLLSNKNQNNNYFDKNNNYFDKNKKEFYSFENKIEPKTEDKNEKQYKFYRQKNYAYQKENHDNYITTKDIAEKWNIRSPYVSLLCKQGRIKGAIKAPDGRTWLIPADAKKPRDRRNKLVIACTDCGWVLDSEKITGTHWCKCGKIGLQADNDHSVVVGDKRYVRTIFDFWKDKHFIKTTRK